MRRPARSRRCRPSGRGRTSRAVRDHPALPTANSTRWSTIPCREAAPGSARRLGDTSGFKVEVDHEHTAALLGEMTGQDGGGGGAPHPTLEPVQGDTTPATASDRVLFDARVGPIGTDDGSFQEADLAVAVVVALVEDDQLREASKNMSAENMEVALCTGLSPAKGPRRSRNAWPSCARRSGSGGTVPVIDQQGGAAGHTATRPRRDRFRQRCGRARAPVPARLVESGGCGHGADRFLGVMNVISPGRRRGSERGRSPGAARAVAGEVRPRHGSGGRRPTHRTVS